MTSAYRLAAAAFCATVPALAAAQSKPPVAQFWADVATNNVSIPGMSEMAETGLFGGFFGGTKMAGGAPGKWLDTALHTRNKPAGTLGTHAIPPTLNMGNSLPLLPVQPVPVGAPGPREEPMEMEKPKGKLLFYWGCGESVRPGQPRVVDFAKAGPEEFSKFMVGRFAPDRGAKAVPGRSVWPNEQDRKRVPNDGSFVGDHAVVGDGVPAGLRFAIGDAYDFMPKVNMSAAGDTKGAVPVQWQSVTNARAYFVTAMGARGSDEMIMWSSSEQPDPGSGLMDYLPPAQIEALLREKVILPPATQNCVIPAGIFGGAQGAMVRMIAYGPELNVVHPPKPADPKAPWNPEWAVRVRVKSTGMTMLGMDERSSGRRSAARDDQPGQEKEESSPGLLPTPGNILRGIFGR